MSPLMINAASPMATTPLFLRALAGEKTERPPVWFMRQAGRYLPEYREIRAKHSMLDVIRTPELASAVTLQPISRFGFDAAIIFADILNPLIGMGIDLDFVQGEGPKIFNPLKSAADVAALRVPAPEENVGYTLDAIRLTVAELNKQHVPLIGFSGAPFTLAYYMIGAGERADRAHEVKRFMREAPDAWQMLMEKLANLVTDYLVAQAFAGASALQLFDSWAGVLGPDDFSQKTLPYVKRIIADVKRRTKVPVIYFAPGGAGLLESLRDLEATAFGIDWRMNLQTADMLLGPGKFALQGNMDPTLLSSSVELSVAQAKKVLREGRELRGHIFNLGHGILPDAQIPAVEAVVEAVKNFKDE